MSENNSYDKFIKAAGVNLDEITMILRSHLLVEYYLDHIIINSLTRGDILLERNFSFSQKLSVLESIQCISSSLLDSVKNLNSIRNNCSHSLDYQITELDVDKIGRPQGRDYLKIKKDHSNTIKELLHWTLGLIITGVEAASEKALAKQE